MPCTDGGVPYPPSPREIAEKDFLKTGPSMLCSACRALDRLGYDFDENPRLSEWWAKHKVEDDARLEREELERQRKDFEKRIIKDALKKPLVELTEEEKKILKKHKYL